MFRLVGDDDREKVVRVWQTAMPPTVFADSIRTVEAAIGDDFAELARRVPELAAS